MFTQSVGKTVVMPTSQNKVLRNTYLLVGLSMLPTVAGAWFGLATGLLASLGMMMTVVLFLVGAFGLMFLIEKNKDSGFGVALLLGFAFFMGIMLSGILGVALGRQNGTQMVVSAFLGTSAVLVIMSFLATVLKRSIEGLGTFLVIGAIMIFVAGLMNLFFQSSALSLALSVLAVGVFSGFILFDIKRIIDGGETNYISASLGLYLSVYNVFSNLLHIFIATDD